ncbi:MAG: DNA-primase RepB domain-containing protein, partial [Chloroflexota bacterium]
MKRIYRKANELHAGNWQALRDLNPQYHVYHRVNVSATENSRKDSITQVVALYVDIDIATPESLKRLEDMKYPPTAIIYSGGGYHGYWMLSEPLAIDSVERRQEVERTMQGMILAYGEGADEKAKDVTRILRTPGFYNIKDKYFTYPLCEVVYNDALDGIRA